MANVSDYELDKDSPASMPPEQESRMGLIIGVVLIVVAIAIGWYVMRDGPVAQDEEAAAPAASDGAGPAAPLPAIDLPPLDQTDTLVRTLAEGLSSNPLLTAWLTPDQVIRRFTVVIDNIAFGRPVRNQLLPVAPQGGFRITTRGSTLQPDPRNYQRYVPLTAAMESIDAVRAAQMYGMLRPRIEEAYKELGRDISFDRALEQAIIALLQAPPIRGNEALVPAKTTGYAYSNPQLESLTPAQKHLLRMGPDNASRVQARLREIALALGIPRERLP